MRLGMEREFALLVRLDMEQLRLVRRVRTIVLLVPLDLTVLVEWDARRVRLELTVHHQNLHRAQIVLVGSLRR